MNFNDFVGNQKVLSEIKNLMAQNRFPHAVIIEGESGVGKTTLAKLMAKWAVCSDKNNKPCDICNNCFKAENNIHPDIITITKPKDKTLIPVSMIREIRSDAYILPNEASKKVYIIDDSDKMDTYCQNIILKILEEPPETVIFIMTCVSSSSMLETVRSRSSVFSLLPVNTDLAVDFLTKHCPAYSYNNIVDAVKNANGNIGKSILALENDYFKNVNMTAESIALAIGEVYEFELLSAVYSLAEDKNFALDVLKALSLILRDSILFSTENTNISPSREVADFLSGRFGKKKLLSFLEIVSESEKMINSNINMNLFVTWFSAVLREKI